MMIHPIKCYYIEKRSGDGWVRVSQAIPKLVDVMSNVSKMRSSITGVDFRVRVFVGGREYTLKEEQ